MTDLHFDMASHYFERLAKRFPVMCASDEFHFLPRAAGADKYYDRLDNLAAEEIEACICEVKAFRNELNRIAVPEGNLEIYIDLELLKANAAGVLIALEKNQLWRHNPLLYLKIAFIGLDHALTKPAAEPEERTERLAARLDAIPRLLGQAVVNIIRIPEEYHLAAREMLNDCMNFLTLAGRHNAVGKLDNLSTRFRSAACALKDFGRFLTSLAPVPTRLFTGPAFESSLRDHFLYSRSLDEIFQLSRVEWHHCFGRLKTLQSQINSQKSWQELYHNYYPSGIETISTHSLYRREAAELKKFFGRHGFKDVELFDDVEICETPVYLRSVRGSASFAAAVTGVEGERSFFYITSGVPVRGGRDTERLLKKRLHREYKFLTAHETIPGHHLLDSIRKRMNNPIRKQIESPLFYEGWATYAETLLAEYGYVNCPIELLVDFKRRLWRSARCQIDVGLSTGKLDRDKSVRLLTQVGFNSREANRQIDRFRLNPGYQLCYMLGSYEIKKLIDDYGPRLGRDNCRAHLLAGGELPFHLMEKRLEALKRFSRSTI